MRRQTGGTRVRGWLLLLLCTAVVSGCRTPEPSFPAEPLTVFAAASLIEPFTELGRLWEQEQGRDRVQFHFAGSQYLVLQLMQGAPGDLLATADARQIQRAATADLIARGEVVPFAWNSLSLVVHPDARDRIANVSDLAQPGVRVGWARAGVPLAVYTERVLASPALALEPGIQDRIRANILSYDSNARTVRNRLVQGEADAAILYASDASILTPEFQVISLPETPADQVILFMVPIASSPHGARAEAFMEFVLGPAGRAVLERYGFETDGVR